MNLRDLARGQTCKIRLPTCSGGGEDTVLCHFRMAGISGVGLKPPDTIGAHGCHKCHDLVDGRVKTDIDRDYIELCFAHGVMRTLAWLHEQGYRLKK